MQSRASDVSSYLKEAPAERRAALDKLRSLCRESLSDCEECIDYGMAAYKRAGVVEVAFASQKQYIALYGMKKVVIEEFRGELGTANLGKGCIRWTKPEKIPFDVLRRMFRRRTEIGAKGSCAAVSC